MCSAFLLHVHDKWRPNSGRRLSGPDVDQVQTKWRPSKEWAQFGPTPAWSPLGQHLVHTWSANWIPTATDHRQRHHHKHFGRHHHRHHHHHHFTLKPCFTRMVWAGFVNCVWTFPKHFVTWIHKTALAFSYTCLWTVYACHIKTNWRTTVQNKCRWCEVHAADQAKDEATVWSVGLVYSVIYTWSTPGLNLVCTWSAPSSTNWSSDGLHA